MFAMPPVLEIVNCIVEGPIALELIWNSSCLKLKEINRSLWEILIRDSERLKILSGRQTEG